jgi:hypothetical protein
MRHKRIESANKVLFELCKKKKLKFYIGDNEQMIRMRLNMTITDEETVKNQIS